MELAIQRQEVGERVFRVIGESAPAFGMVGTLVGLLQMLSSMDDPTTIGRAMAIALLTTLYGLLIAQLIALTISDKLEAKNAIEKANRVLIIEAIIQIHERNNPTAVLDILEKVGGLVPVEGETIVLDFLEVGFVHLEILHALDDFL